MKHMLTIICLLYLFICSTIAQDVHPDKMKYSKTKYLVENPLMIVDQVFEGGLSIMDCHNIIVKNCEIIGELSLTSSYPEYGLRNIRFEDCYVHDATTDRLLMMGGSAISNIVFKKCIFLRCIGGTHSLYFSGGHWNSDYPPVDGIKVIQCIIGITPAGRHGIQFNGRFTNGVIRGNSIYNSQLCGLSFIGCQNFDVSNNIIYGNNRGGLVLFDYAGSWAPYYNYYQTQEDIDEFLSEHQPNQNIDIHHNTIIQGPKQFSVDQWHSDDPQDNHGAITINNGVHSGFKVYLPEPQPPRELERPNYIEPPEPNWEWMKGEEPSPNPADYIIMQFNFPSANINIHDNIIVTPNKRVIAVSHEHEATHTAFTHNMVFCIKPGIPYLDQFEHLKNTSGNWLQNPMFVHNKNMLPKYDFVDLIKNPDYDWTKFKTSFDPYSWPGYVKKVGKPIKIAEAQKGNKGKQIEEPTEE